MQKYRERIEALERRLLHRQTSGIYQRIRSALYHDLSDAELDLLESAEDGFNRGRSLTPMEAALVERINGALEAECQRAGFESAEACRQALISKPASLRVSYRR